MKWHTPHKKNKKSKNKKTQLHKQLFRNQTKRKVYMNKPKGKKKRSEVNDMFLANRKRGLTIDYTSLRECSISLFSCMTPNLNYDVDWKFYYDETYNFKKLHH